MNKYCTYVQQHSKHCFKLRQLSLKHCFKLRQLSLKHCFKFYQLSLILCLPHTVSVPHRRVQRQVGNRERRCPQAGTEKGR